jgi:hypothetical protein
VRGERRDDRVRLGSGVVAPACLDVERIRPAGATADLHGPAFEAIRQREREARIATVRLTLRQPCIGGHEQRERLGVLGRRYAEHPPRIER